MGLRIEYCADLEDNARSIMPSRSAVIAMMVLDMDVAYSEVKGAFIIEASEVHSWKERLNSFQP